MRLHYAPILSDREAARHRFPGLGYNSRFMKSARLLREFGALLLLVLAVALVFGDVVAGSARLWGDFVSWYFPSREYVAESLRAHRLPLWNPFMDAGMPFLGEADHGLFYPPALLLQPVSRHRLILYRCLEFFVLAHAAWAAISMYLLARSLRCRQYQEQQSAELA
jgi:hypothetical protein